MRNALYLGRFQPPHLGHLSIVKKLLEEYDGVVIACRDRKGLDDPYTFEERCTKWRELISSERVQIIKIPDVVCFAFGRTPGFEVREVRLDEDIESISASKIRASGG